MIKKLSLKNFQSHPESELEFHPGVNVLVGSSDNGKSAILRAFSWVRSNSPSGGQFVSHWAKNKKGNQVDSCYAVVSKEVGQVTRERDRAGNRYILNEEEFNAVRSDVPEQVQDFFNMTDVNIQSQHDRPFLLFETPGEVARILNRVVKLDVIDRALSGIDSKKRASKKNIDQLTRQKEEIQEALKRYAGLEEFGKNLQTYEDEIVLRDKRVLMLEGMRASVYSIRDLKVQIYEMNPVLLVAVEDLLMDYHDSTAVYYNTKSFLNELVTLVYDIQKTTRKIDVDSKVGNLATELASMEKVYKDTICKKEELTGLISWVSAYSKIGIDLGNERSIVALGLDIIDYSVARDLYINYLDIVNNLQEMLTKILTLTIEIESISEELHELETQTPDVCPTCGTVLREDR